MAREMVAAIAASGVQVVGDLSMLVPALSPSGTDRPGLAAAATTAAAGRATPVIAATMAMGILATAGEIRNGVEVTAGAGAGAGTIGSPDRALATSSRARWSRGPRPHGDRLEPHLEAGDAAIRVGRPRRRRPADRDGRSVW